MVHAILADIHGNLLALQAVLDDLVGLDVESLIVAGDLLTGGPRPWETLALLRRRRARLIVGNGDASLLACFHGHGPTGWREGLQWAPLRWSYGRLDLESLRFLASLPEQCVLGGEEGPAMRIVHGSPRAVGQFVTPAPDSIYWAAFQRAGSGALFEGACTASEALAEITESALVCAHSHIPWEEVHGRRLVLNPGSVGAPINGDARAQYALLSYGQGGWQVEYRQVAYELAALADDFGRQGLLAQGGPMARAFMVNMLSGENTAYDLLRHAMTMVAAHGLFAEQPIPDAVWLEAEASYAWGPYGEWS